MNSRRIVISGLGIIAPTGIGKNGFWNGISQGQSFVSTITSFDPSNLSSQIAAEAKAFDPSKYLSLKDVKKVGRANHFAVAGAMEAIADGAFTIKDSELKDIAVIIGTNCGGVSFGEEEMKKFYSAEQKRMSTYTVTGTFSGGITGDVSIALNIKGPSFTVSSGLTSGSDSLILALQMIKSGIIKTAFAGGVEACITPGILTSLCQMGSISTSKNSDPQKASCPFSLNRDGFVLGEGGWIFILEELNHAIERGAHIYAEITGYGINCAPNNKNNRTKEVSDTIKLALKESNLNKEEINYICAHGISTISDDVVETKAIKEVFEEKAYKLPISSIKSMIGYPLGAGGSANVASSILALENDFIPPTINFDIPDPDCDLNYTPNNGIPLKITTVLSLSLGLNSGCSVIILKKYKC
ncbi:hypothetical protein A2526_05335 [candidate division WOR-1 bacterium RIFOXYD2_FULL_36_8]|uniref:Ketosynthase family 3 (KS3) domain-containing protein n=1 Tax=candidate division WOR-1 bacterium RIFOXYB2_FULL_36_35 TaxID=1802578 RepID=A0A1F4RXS9_UNCSA|nr:MAG: hypothetical protein A2230_03300 [candidate division WOR-1 bacterium RIFOXYA2_FULL_36_21]OGC12985.1 MAG: hypothetical protein A2290_04900 [candidate division WOR-1 bacterium RIFOXYB2_FULL_36_35]OGC19992.1 MAG: hypothetical protein A2282_08320 [candidate division WOR-1 bacterium RIFOXYA12_FULL_36_13]OGC41240.1 MAG: hypothetical protein A2526_05335 [candidate division WOR-1 bacterium RIFOXYD2_FULL_36_8]